jgi:hypothetical protein
MCKVVQTRPQIAATRRSDKFLRVNRRILVKILSLRQNFVAANYYYYNYLYSPFIYLYI